MGGCRGTILRRPGAGRGRWPGAAAMLAFAVMATLLAVAASASAAEIDSRGPLQRVIVSDQLNCQVKHQADTQLSFFGGEPGACGTFLATGGTLYGPEESGTSPRTVYTPVSQTGPTGSGTPADPYRIVTVVDAGTSGLRIEQTDSYVTGDEAYRTDVRIINTTDKEQGGLVYRAGDCYLQSSDAGFGRVDGKAISCVGDDASQPGTQPGERIEQFLPITQGSSYYESSYSSVWAQIGAQQAFADSCEKCATFADNGAGLSWPFTVAGNGSATFTSFITFSPLGRQPLQMTTTADDANTQAGGNDAYTITVSNPNTMDATIDAIMATLPAGFNYRPGTTTEPGGGTSDPAVDGQQLTWSGPYKVPAGENVQLHFGVAASETPGTYFANASGDSASFTVIPTGPTAPITVEPRTQPPSEPQTPSLDPPGQPQAPRQDPATPNLTVTGPATDLTGSTHVAGLTATAGDTGAPLAGVPLRWSIAGAHPQNGTATTAGNGTASVQWKGTKAGRDTLAAFLDLNGDGVQGAGEPGVVHGVDWLAPPSVGKTANVEPVSGTVLVKLPAGADRRKYRLGPAQASGFIRLSEAAEIPLRSTLDTTRGRVEVQSSVGVTKPGQTQSGQFYAGVAEVRQTGGTRRPVTEMVLNGTLECRSNTRDKVSSAAKRSRQLWGSVKGRFRTRGRHSSATVRGTEWLTKDTCNTTTTLVKTGVVTVRDFAKRKNITLRKGKRYVARAKRR